MVILNPYYRDSLAFYYEKKDSYHFHVRNRNLPNKNISIPNKIITFTIISLMCLFLAFPMISIVEIERRVSKKHRVEKWVDDFF